MTEGNKSACDARHPKSRQSRRDALAGWDHRVGLPGYRRFLNVAFATLPDLEADIEDNRVRTEAAVYEDVAKYEAACGSLRTALNKNAIIDIEAPSAICCAMPMMSEFLSPSLPTLRQMKTAR
ncbi:hypothetical protein AAIB41_11580 [Brucella sp. BE17]|uniref:hypothetical protein n=1 Tax=Brucella sp. BE17 TaxID=3142977 RepID=UPI0031B9BDEA